MSALKAYTSLPTCYFCRTNNSSQFSLRQAVEFTVRNESFKIDFQTLPSGLSSLAVLCNAVIGCTVVL